MHLCRMAAPSKRGCSSNYNNAEPSRTALTTMAIKRPIIAILLALLLAVTPLSPCHGAGLATGVDTHLSILLRVLKFGRKNISDTDGVTTVGVLYQGDNRESAQILKDVMARLADTSLTQLVEGGLLAVAINLDGRQNLDSVLLASSVDLAYVTPLQGYPLQDICDATREHHVLSLTGVPEYVERGVSVGVDVYNQKPKILINRGAAESEGTFFYSRLLQLAKVYNNKP